VGAWSACQYLPGSGKGDFLPCFLAGVPRAGGVGAGFPVAHGQAGMECLVERLQPWNIGGEKRDTGAGGWRAQLPGFLLGRRWGPGDRRPFRHAMMRVR